MSLLCIHSTISPVFQLLLLVLQRLLTRSFSFLKHYIHITLNLWGIFASVLAIQIIALSDYTSFKLSGTLFKETIATLL